MKKATVLKKILYFIAAACLVIGMLPLTHITEVFADESGSTEPTQSEEVEGTREDGETSGEEEVSGTSEGTETPEPDSGESVEETETPSDETGEEESAGETEETLEEGESDNADEDVVDAEDEPEEEVTEEDEIVDEDGSASEEEGEDSGEKNQEEELADLIEFINEEDIVLENDEGEAVSLASNEGLEVLSSSDPFFWNPTTNQWEGYTKDGTGCPANVICFADLSPFQAAVSAAPVGSTIYVAQNTYAENVVIDTADLSLIGFSSVDVPDGTSSTLTYVSGYAVVDSITLNVDFNTTLGVYADMVIVNAGGMLDDGLALADVDGEVEASVVIYSADGHYRVKDANHPEINYEWECGEPDVLIYPGRVYRMVFKKPTSQDIFDYYENIGDETGEGRTTEQRINDLLEGIKRSDLASWSHTNEEKVFWYLLGQVGANNGLAANGTTTIMNATQQALASSVINRVSDTPLSGLGVWFLWPILENTNTDVSPLTRQLTLLHYMMNDIPGCTDPAAKNYNPVANLDDGSCEYCVPTNGCPTACGYAGGFIDDGCGNLIYCDATGACDPGDPGDPGGGTTTLNAPVIPVTGGAGGPTEELLIIPVTGIEFGGQALGLQQVFSYVGLMVFGIAMIIDGITHKMKF